MSDLKPYTVVVDGITYTLLLSEDDAKKRGATPAGSKARKAAPNKMRTPEQAPKETTDPTTKPRRRSKPVETK